MNGTVLVTGASGKTGRAVAGAAAAAGLPVRSLVRPGSGAVVPGESRPGDLDTSEGLVAAMTGCDAVYLIAPNMHADEPGLVARVVAAARSAGVARIVYHSVLHPYVPAMPHHLAKAAGEDVLRRSGLEWTVVQPCAYVQNLIPARPPTEIVVPYSPTARFSLVDLSDVGAAAATVLRDSRHVGATYELCGPARVSARDVAGVVGVPVRQIGIQEWRRATGAALSERVQDGLAAMFAYYDEHGLVGNPHVLRWLLGREPKTVADVAAAATT